METADTDTTPTLKPSPTVPFIELHERKFVLLLCILAAIHVFIFSAGFPFFNNVDEGMHFDLVMRYAHGEVPGQIELISTNAGVYMGLMSSHEFYEPANAFPGNQFPAPIWTLPAEQMQPVWAARSGIWQTEYNYEVSQPPLYYALAGAWWHMGGWLGLEGGRLVYWLRFLNVLLVSALVWLAYATARLVFPKPESLSSSLAGPKLLSEGGSSSSNPVFLRLAVPTILAFMPQSAFYSLGNDIVAAWCFGLTFYFLIQWMEAESLSLRLGIALGLAFAAAYLAKATDIPVLAITTIALLFKAWRQLRRDKSKTAETARAVGAFLLCAELPVIAWVAWCRAHFGDITGSAPKAHFLGWTIKPFSQWWHHPIFSPVGLWTYLTGELGTFWQGEIWWHGPRLCLPGTDPLFALLSVVLLAIALPSVWCTRFSVLGSAEKNQKTALQLALACFIAELAFFALMSIIYDFHKCVNPSREHPYFEAGRMMFGALIPFLLVFVCGLDRLLSRLGLGTTIKFATLITMVAAMLTLEIVMDRPAFASPYNWYHLAGEGKSFSSLSSSSRMFAATKGRSIKVFSVAPGGA
ncbi:MAG TPA: DUF2142 domain-containing protein [Verrucomicrobiae bacterium]|jgi:hypothetical protein|nr:DUF2142 domain-containing protein [Verrucomicrobiae bacterium]